VKNRVTGLQAYQFALARLLEAAREQMGPREYEALLALHRRWLVEGGSDNSRGKAT
jgi:hypothetical protein